MLTPQFVLPEVGQFLRPVGPLRFGFSYRVVRHWEPEHPLDLVRTACQRWGLKDKHAFDDGHVAPQGQHSILVGLREVLPRVWRESGVDAWGLEPVYLVLADGPDAQRDLFSNYTERQALKAAA